MKKNLIILAILSVFIFSCSSDDNPEPITTPTSTTTTTVAAIQFTNLKFSETDRYFSTNGSMTSPVFSSNQISSTIDITFIYNSDYGQPGFFDPVARSSEWYWDDYYMPSLSNAVETKYYSSTLTQAEFDAAKSDESLIGTYFSNTASMVLAPHSIFPTGSCIGGRQSNDPTSSLLYEGRVFGFRNLSTGKRGLLYIRNDQPQLWPLTWADDYTTVDIIREN